MTRLFLSDEQAVPMARRAFPEYRGAKFEFRTALHYAVHAGELCWSGGSKKEVAVLHQKLGGGLERAELTTMSPWSGDRWSGPIPQDMLIIEWVQFCGKDLGLRFIAAPNSTFVPKGLLDKPRIELTDHEKVVLAAHQGLKSSARNDFYKSRRLTVVTLAEAKEGLVRKGLLTVNKAGASQLTLAGKNEASRLREEEPRAFGSCI